METNSPTPATPEGATATPEAASPEVATLGDAAGAVLPVSESTAEATEPTAPATPVLDDLGRAYGTGRRKESVARVWIRPGNGKIEINGRNSEHYFPRMAQRIHAVSPLKQVGLGERLDVYATVKGGGVSGQAGGVAPRLGAGFAQLRPRVEGHFAPCGNADSRLAGGGTQKIRTPQSAS